MGNSQNFKDLNTIFKEIYTDKLKEIVMDGPTIIFKPPNPYGISEENYKKVKETELFKGLVEPYKEKKNEDNRK